MCIFFKLWIFNREHKNIVELKAVEPWLDWIKENQECRIPARWEHTVLEFKSCILHYFKHFYITYAGTITLLSMMLRERVQKYITFEEKKSQAFICRPSWNQGTAKQARMWRKHTRNWKKYMQICSVGSSTYLLNGLPLSYLYHHHTKGWSYHKIFYARDW